MKLFALRDEAYPEKDLAYLEVYEAEGAFFFELPPDADPWELPFILHEFAQRGQRTIDANWSRTWVESRLVPPERQNLGEILRENGLEEYSEIRLLELTQGQCAQDACYLVPVGGSQLPDWYWKRKSSRITDVFALSGFRIVCTQAQGPALLCNMGEMLEGRREFARVIRDESAFGHVALQAGGHGVRWGDGLLISARELTACAIELPLSAQDLALMARQVLVDTAEAASILGCTRQNIADLVRRQRLEPIKTGPRSMLFLRAEILARRDALGS